MNATDRAGAESVPVLAEGAGFDPAASLARLRIEFRLNILGRTDAAGLPETTAIAASLDRRSQAADPAAAASWQPRHPSLRTLRISDRVHRR